MGREKVECEVGGRNGILTGMTECLVPGLVATSTSEGGGTAGSSGLSGGRLGESGSNSNSEGLFFSPSLRVAVTSASFSVPGLLQLSPRPVSLSIVICCCSPPDVKCSSSLCTSTSTTLQSRTCIVSDCNGCSSGIVEREFGSLKLK